MRERKGISACIAWASSVVRLRLDPCWTVKVVGGDDGEVSNADHNFRVNSGACDLKKERGREARKRSE